MPLGGEALAASWIAKEDEGRLIIDAELTVLWLNEVAERELAVGRDLQIRSGAVRALKPGIQTQLLDLIKRARDGLATACLCFESGAKVLVRARFLTSANGQEAFGLAYFATDRQYRFADLDKAFSLTPCEHRVILRLLDGLTADEVAQRLGSAKDTVRTHIRSAYAKMQVSSREELFRRVQPFRV